MSGSVLKAGLHTLANGVRVVTDPMPGLASGCVGVWVRAGARWETEAENGIAHLLEHLVFKGAGGRGTKALAEEAEARGIYLNAATGYERTGFFARCLSEDVGFALDLTSDLVLRPHLDEADLALEKGVVLQEIGEAFDDAEDRCGVLHQAASFTGQALGRPILGDAQSLDAITKAHIEAFRDRLYHPSAIIVAAAGGIDPAAIIEAAEARFGGLKPQSAPNPEPATLAGTALSEMRKSEQVHLAMSLPGPAQGGNDALAARVLCEILGGGMASRLFQDLRETRGLVYSVEAYCDLYEDIGRISFGAGCSAKDGVEVSQRVGAHLHAMAKDGPATHELARAKRILEASMMMGAEGPAQRCEAGVAQTLIYGAPRALSEVADLVRAISAENVQAIARSALAQKEFAAAAAVGPKKGLEAAPHFAASL
jgi:predicted Zn-dependent peptidase